MAKIATDLLMLALFFYLMAYQTVRGLMNHAAGGIALFALFLLHHWLNRSWYRSLSRGRYNARRRLLAISNTLLLFVMLLMAGSSLSMSGAVFAFSPLPMTQAGHDLHVLSTAWGFMLMGLHCGLHTHALLEGLRRRCAATPFAYAWYLLLLLGGAAGAYAFIRSGLWSDLLLLHALKAPFAGFGDFCLTYAGIMLALCLAAHLLLSVTERSGKCPKDARTQLSPAASE